MGTQTLLSGSSICSAIPLSVKYTPREQEKGEKGTSNIRDRHLLGTYMQLTLTFVLKQANGNTL